jgi:type I pantothenate kinase
LGVPSRIDKDHGVPTLDRGFEVFTREQWAALGHRHRHPGPHRAGSTLTVAETERLVATGEPVSTEEVADVYFPLAEFLTLLAAHQRELDQRIGAFLSQDRPAVPFIIGIAGSVAVGKSTTARILQALLRQSAGPPTGAGPPSVDLLTTDGFLYPNAVLEARGLMERKGFPESYDQKALIEALAAIRAGQAEVATPVYSHLSYDIVPGQVHVLRRPAIVIVEGLNVLGVNTKGAPPEHVVASDFFDFSVFVDAAEEDIARWFTERLLALRSTVLQEPDAFFHRFADLPDDEVTAIARQIWSEINLVNLRENVAPTRGRAHLVLEKGRDHHVSRVLLRRT